MMMIPEPPASGVPEGVPQPPAPPPVLGAPAVAFEPAGLAPPPPHPPPPSDCVVSPEP